MKRIDTMCIRDMLRHHHDLGLPALGGGRGGRERESGDGIGISWSARRRRACHGQMGRLGRVSQLVVLDDWGLQGFSSEGRRDLLEIVEQRHGRKSILIASQIPVEGWPKVIGEGPELLQGLALCGVCGDRMTVRYHTLRGRQVPDYWCQREGESNMRSPPTRGMIQWGSAS